MRNRHIETPTTTAIALKIPKALILDLFIDPLKRQRFRVFRILAALLVLTSAHSFILLLMKPFVEALFGSELQSAKDTSIDLLQFADLVPPFFSNYFESLNHFSFSRNDLAYAVPILIFIAGLIKAFGTYFYQVNQQALTLFVAKNYRDKLFEAIVKMDYESIRKKSPSEWMSIVMNDVQFLQMRFADILNGFVRDSMTILAAFAIILIVHWQTALFVLLILPVIAFGMGKIGSNIAGYAENFQKDLARISSAILDVRKRFMFIRAQGGESFEQARFEIHNQSYYDEISKSIMLRSAFAPVLEFLGFAFLALIIMLFGSGKFSGSLEAGTLITFFVALGLMVKPLRNFGEQISKYHETKGALKSSMLVFLDSKNTNREPQISRKKSLELNRVIDIKSLSAGFEEKTAFEATDLRLELGQSIAVVGASGAGKSTLLKLLSGLLPPQSWSGDLDWEDVVGFSNLVSQEPFLFQDTIIKNLTYGLSDGSSKKNEEKIWQALKVVGLYDLIKGLPDGLESNISGFSKNFSGGQVQRLVIARALLRDKYLLLLDEATSAIDSKTEKQIISGLIEQSKNKGRFLISVTHRLRWLELYDQIWLMSAGKIIAKGTHSKLMENEDYRKFYGNDLAGSQS